jgi:PAS domain S-box-containing protein
VKTTSPEALILDSLPMGVLFCDRAMIIRFVNKSYADLLGLEAGQILGRDIREVIPHSRAPQVMERGVPEMGELCRLGPGNKNPVIVNRIPVRGGDGQIAGMVSQAIFNNPEELQRLSSKIEHLDRKISQYERRMKAGFAAQYTFRNLIGESGVMHRLKRQARNYARLDEAVLILGPTGAGKELFAHAIHSESPRADGPMVCINCAAIPRDLFESELFGHERGAFSGARHEGRMGQIELAHHGTLFLDEIGEMPPEAQAKLLRVLECRAVRRLGSVTPRAVDFRLLAATNRNITAMLERGSFREDLYYRINTFTLEIPPLCERADDIVPIARQILERMGLGALRFSDSAEFAMRAFSWPGNVRQLHNAVVHAATLRQNDVIEIDDFPPEIVSGMRDLQNRQKKPARDDLQGVAANAEISAILKAISECGGNVSAAARKLRIARATIYEKMRKYGICRP